MCFRFSCSERPITRLKGNKLPTGTVVSVENNNQCYELSTVTTLKITRDLDSEKKGKLLPRLTSDHMGTTFGWGFGIVLTALDLLVKILKVGTS